MIINIIVTIIIILLLLIDSVNGLFRLNAEGTQILDNLDSNGKSKFFQNLVNELANAVPIIPDRLVFKKYQTDYTVSPPAQLILIGVLRPGDNDNVKIDVAQIINNL